MMMPEEFVEEYEAALATQDWRYVSPLIHQNACVTFSTGEAFIGKPEVQKAYERNFAMIESEKYNIADLH